MKDKILELRSQGKTYTEISDIVGCSKGTVSYYCGAGQKEKATERLRDRRSQRRKLIQEAKSNKACVDCGEKYPYWIMQFDHLGDKLFTIGDTRASRGLALDKIREEIAKCDVVCANCHANRTHSRLVKSGADVLEFIMEG